MTGAEQGFLLLASHLGDSSRPVLTVSQFRNLAHRMRCAEGFREERELQLSDLISLGYGREMAERILRLLRDEEQLRLYISRGKRLDCVPVTRITGDYPMLFRQRLGWESPGTLWAKGNLSLLRLPAVSLVGSRELRKENYDFAKAVGSYAASKGLVLISGNARGADRTAQDACLDAGGKVISIVADELWKHRKQENVLYLSEEDYDSPFTAQRALSRNRCIHALGRMVFVAQCDMKKGGTWDGTAKNLRYGWSPVACFRDGSAASQELEQMGAYLIDTENLEDFDVLQEQTALF